MGRPNVKHKNGALAVGVAAAAVLAVVSGGAVAAQRGPAAASAGAAPLPAGPAPTTPSPKPSSTPSSTPSLKPKPKPTPSRSGIPATVTIDLAKLPLGRRLLSGGVDTLSGDDRADHAAFVVFHDEPCPQAESLGNGRDRGQLPVRTPLRLAEVRLRHADPRREFCLAHAALTAQLGQRYRW